MRTALCVACLVAAVAVAARMEACGPRGVTFTQLGSYGRLGNQLFQIAAVHHIARAWGVPALFPARNLPAYEVVDTATAGKVIPDQVLAERGPTAYEMPPDGGGILDLRGYFQNQRYVSTIPALRSPLPVRSNTVGVHVRRGDYAQLAGIFRPLSADYYAKAAGTACAAASARAIVVCSDDMAWARQNFRAPPGVTVEFSRCTRDVDDFKLLASCTALVMSNSSFSWWAAQYNKSVVVCPWPWFTPGGTHDAWNDRAALVRPGWITA